MPLNNSGDDVSLIDPQGQVHDPSGTQPRKHHRGQLVTLEQP